ncbi:MAG: hypothetical protein AAB011_10485, partial [Candidatus Eisenbacteria bacterium]
LRAVMAVAGLFLAAAFLTHTGSDRSVKAVTLDVVPSEVPPPVSAVTDPAFTEPTSKETPSDAADEEVMAPAPIPTEPAITSRAVSSTEPVGTAGMVVGIDPVTGKVGMPSREFRDALRESHAAPALSRSMDGLQVIHRPDGSKMVDLKGRFQEYSVIRIAPDGRKEQLCVQGPDLEAALQGKVGGLTSEAEAAASNGGSEAEIATEPQER